MALLQGPRRVQSKCYQIASVLEERSDDTVLAPTIPTNFPNPGSKNVQQRHIYIFTWQMGSGDARPSPRYSGLIFSFLSIQHYLKEVRTGIITEKKKSNLVKAHKKSTGGFISGEVKLTLTLRLLSGGLYMDLALLYKTWFPRRSTHGKSSPWLWNWI